MAQYALTVGDPRAIAKKPDQKIEKKYFSVLEHWAIRENREFGNFDSNDINYCK